MDTRDRGYSTGWNDHVKVIYLLPFDLHATWKHLISPYLFYNIINLLCCILSI